MSSFYRGKIILTGEHSVVHGYSAILASLDLGVSCTAKEGNLEEAQKLDPYLQHLLQIFSKMTKIKEIKANNLVLSRKREATSSCTTDTLPSAPPASAAHCTRTIDHQ